MVVKLAKEALGRRMCCGSSGDVSFQCGESFVVLCRQKGPGIFFGGSCCSIRRRLRLSRSGGRCRGSSGRSGRRCRSRGRSWPRGRNSLCVPSDRFLLLFTRKQREGGGGHIDGAMFRPQLGAKRPCGGSGGSGGRRGAGAVGVRVFNPRRGAGGGGGSCNRCNGGRRCHYCRSNGGG